MSKRVIVDVRPDILRMVAVKKIYLAKPNLAELEGDLWDRNLMVYKK